MKKRIIALVALLAVSGVAYGLNVNSQLIKAYLEKLASDPVDGAEGRIIYNTTEKKAKLHNGTAWGSLGGGGQGEALIVRTVQ
jgi:hypothetical protein